MIPIIGVDATVRSVLSSTETATPLSDWDRHFTRIGARKALARGEEPAEIVERFCVLHRDIWGWIDQAVIEETTRIVLGAELH